MYSGFLKRFASQLYFPLFMIFNSSLHESTLSIVVPFIKKNIFGI